MAFYRLATAAKLTERSEAGTVGDIEATYCALAEKLLGEYGEHGGRMAVPGAPCPPEPK